MDASRMRREALVPDDLREVWSEKQDVIVSHDGTCIDFHGGGTYWWEPKHLTEHQLEKVTDTFVMSLLHEKVASVYVSLCSNLSDQSIIAIAQSCPKLKELYLSNIHNLTDASIMSIANGCPQLRELHVEDIKSVTDESIKAIAKGCPLLKELHVDSCEKLADESIKTIAQSCPELKELHVSEIENLTDESIIAIAKGCPRLTELSVWGIENLTDESIKAIAIGCPELNALHASQIESLTDESIMAIAEGCPRLKDLNVRGTKSITDESVKAIAEGCREVLKLDVAGIQNITDESIKTIAKGCPELKELNVGWIENLTDESIKAIAQGCPQLKKLNVISCRNLTDESIKAIAEGCPELKALHVSQIENLTDESIVAIAEGCPRLKKLGVCGIIRMTDESVKAIAEGCREVLKLYVSKCENLTDDSMKAIAKGCRELKALDVSWCRLSMKAISAGCPRLEVLDARNCGLASLPADFFERLPLLTDLILNDNSLSRLPPSILKHKHLRSLDVSQNPLQSPPYEIALRGVDAIKRYFEALEKGSSVSKLLKVVLVGDGEAGKTSLRNALAGRPHPRQKDHTIHLDIEKITLTSDLDINVYDCGGQEEYLATQLPYLTGLALYIVVVEAQYATDEYAHVVEDKLHRFLVVLQNRVPGAVVLPIVTKVDTVKDPARRCQWLESTIEKWLQDTREAVCCDLPDSTSSGPPPPALLDSSARDVRIAGHTHSFIPLRIQSPALAVSVADTGIVGSVRDSVRAVRDRIVALTIHKPPLLRGVGQQIPSTYVAVLTYFGAIAEYGDNDLALEALRNDKAHALGETSELSPGGTYRPKAELKKVWNRYSDHPDGSVQSKVFDDATQLWEAQGLIFVDAGLVVLQPEFLTTIVKPLFDHRYIGEKKYKQIEDDVVPFLKSTWAHDNDCYNQLVKALTSFKASGEVDCSDESLLLAFLWRDTGLDRRHYGQVLRMLVKSGVILKVGRDTGERRTVVVVPLRLPRNPDETMIEKFWPKALPSKERELKLRFEPRPAFPTGLAERFVTDVHGLGTSLYCWRSGVVVKDRSGYSVLAKRSENVLHFSVRFEAYSSEKADVAWKALCDAQKLLATQRKNRFPGLFYEECFVCEECCRNREPEVAREIFNAKRRKCVFAACGHCFDLDAKGNCDQSSVAYHFHERVSKAQFVGVAEGDVTSNPRRRKSRRTSRRKKQNASNAQFETPSRTHMDRPLRVGRSSGCL